MLAWSVPRDIDLASVPAAGRSPVPIADFTRQYAQIRQEVLAVVEAVCEGQHFILGEEVRAFEAAAASICGTTYGVGCASGTDALWLAMAAAQIGRGDRVVTTPFSFFASVSSILRAEARPILADIDPRTYNLCPREVRTVLEREAKQPKASQDSSSVRAILPVHLYGQCAAWDEFLNLQKEYGVLLIEDAAQAFGAKWKGRPAGSLGDLAAFSFYPTKNLSAYGDAGLLTTGSAAFAERASMLRGHGMRQRYLHDEIGWNSRLDTIQAAILLVKLRYIDRWNRQRRERAAYYDELFDRHGVAEPGPYPQHGVVLPFIDPGGTHIFHQYVIRSTRRDEMRSFLAERGIGSEIYYPLPLHLQPSLRLLGYTDGDFPESERAAREVLALPIFPELTPEEQERVVSAISDFLA